MVAPRGRDNRCWEVRVRRQDDVGARQLIAKCGYPGLVNHRRIVRDPHGTVLEGVHGVLVLLRFAVHAAIEPRGKVVSTCWRVHSVLGFVVDRGWVDVHSGDGIKSCEPCNLDCCGVGLGNSTRHYEGDDKGENSGTRRDSTYRCDAFGQLFALLGFLELGNLFGTASVSLLFDGDVGVVWHSVSCRCVGSGNYWCKP